VSVESLLFRDDQHLAEPQSGKFPVFSLVIREFDPETGSHLTAPSVNESFSVYNFSER
jgi:hypothetical protein